MNTINLDTASVVELNLTEVMDVNGGGMRFILGIANDIYENWDTYKKAFLDGLHAGNRIL
jgi:hypothetical protein